MITAKPFYTSQTKAPYIQVTVLDYLEVFIAIIFLNKKTIIATQVNTFEMKVAICSTN